ncbi:unnamed protein product, partial [Owenia fusiformis]
MGNIFAEPAENDNQPSSLGQTALERLRDQLECPICYKDYSSVPPNPPKILRCGHSFCAICIGRLKTYNSIKCPLCQKQTTSNGRRRNLPDNFLAKQILESVDEVSKINSTHRRCSTCSREQVQISTNDQSTMTNKKPTSDKSTMTLPETNRTLQRIKQQALNFIIFPFVLHVLCYCIEQFVDLVHFVSTSTWHYD